MNLDSECATVGTALQVRDFSVRFGEKTILDRLSFDVASGSSLAVIGANGAGKTVLFQSLVGAIPHEGTARWAPGTRIGYVPQKLDIERDLPVTGNDFLRAKRAVTRASPAQVSRALEQVSLDQHVAALPLGTLSGGQFQRLLMAVALVGQPTVLLLDEPTAGVDERGQATMNETVERLRHEQSMTVLLISHDVSVVSRYASNVLCLRGDGARWSSSKAMLTTGILGPLCGPPIDNARPPAFDAPLGSSR